MAASPVSAGTVSARIAAALEPHVSDVFGVMGNGNAWFLDAVVTSTSLHYTAVRHEAAAVAAADAYYRAGGRLAIATTTYGPGFTNAITPLDRGRAGPHPARAGHGRRTRPARPCDIDQRARRRGRRRDVPRGRRRTTPAGQPTRPSLWRSASRTAVVLAIPYRPRRRAQHAALCRASRSSLRPSDSPAAASTPRASTARASRPRPACSPAPSRPLILAGRGAWLAGAQDAAAALATRLGALPRRPPSRCRSSTDEPGSGGSLGISGGFATEATADEIAQRRRRAGARRAA